MINPEGLLAAAMLAGLFAVLCLVTYGYEVWYTWRSHHQAIREPPE